MPSCWNLKGPIGNKETQLDGLNLEMKTPVSSKQCLQFLIEKNSIASLSLPDDVIVTNHDQKAGILWEAFKNRLGVSVFTEVTYDLHSLLQRHDLNFLADDFTEEDYNKVISEIPSNHAPGPDGLNGKCIKKCWSIIKPDFLRLFSDFFRDFTDLTSIKLLLYHLDS